MNRIAASCAAPYFFKPSGNLQDGALKANNPSFLAHLETKHLYSFPFSPGNPDYAIHFGTGQFSEDPGKSHTRPMAFIPKWASQLWFALKDSIDAEKAYRRFLCQLTHGERQRHYRVNPSLPMAPALLDNASVVEKIRKITIDQMLSRDMSALVAGIRTSFISSLFYPVLSQPSFDRATELYRVTVGIGFRWEDDVVVTSRTREFLRDAHFLVENKPFQFRTPLLVPLTFSSLEESLTIELELSGTKSTISGQPNSFGRILYLQNAHGKPNVLSNIRKRKRQYLEEPIPRPAKRREIGEKLSLYSPVW